MAKTHFRLLNRDGTINVERKTHGKILRSDLYYSLLSLSWPRFIAFTALLFIGINFVFGFLYFLAGATSFEGMRQSTEWIRFYDSFFFSVQSFATIGYGRISPVSFTANILVTIEAFLGILYTALATGLVFGRFSRPIPKVIFSDKAVITTIDGEPCVVLRAANERLNQVSEARVQLFMVQTFHSKEGERYRDFTVLDLERDFSPFFALSWTIVHPINEKSPFYQATRESLEEKESELFLWFTGVDEVLSQNIYSRISYIGEDFHWNHRFADMITRNKNHKLEIDLEKINKIIPVKAQESSF